jgi:PleD family two-component response regulator
VEDLYVIHEENVISVTISMGLSNDGDNLDSKIISADKLLYQSKENGRNQISY